MEKNMKIAVLKSITKELTIAKEFIYDMCDFKITQIYKQEESSDYVAYIFRLNDLNIIFRSAKITPKKIGQFVTLWRRKVGEPIQPYDISDDIDFFVVCVSDNDHMGHFVFPKTVLYEKGIVSKNSIGGKRAIRVYPPWIKTISKQAQKTQKWQLEFFFSIGGSKEVDLLHVKSLFLK